MDSAEFTEWLAYYELEPFGELVADQRHGVATQVLANVHRNPKARPEPYTAEDFIHWRDTGPVEDTEPVLLDDPKAQSDLIRAALFGVKPS